MIETTLGLLLLGLIAGTIGSLVGLGGGIVIVPVLLYMAHLFPDLGITPQMAAATSLFVIIFVSLSSTLGYAKHKQVDFKSANLFFLASGPGAIVGAMLNDLVRPGAFMIFFGAFMIFVSLLLMMRSKMKPKRIRWNVTRHSTDPQTGEPIQFGYNIVLALCLSFIVGILGSLLGIGGGSLMMPVMLLLFRYPVVTAAATSMWLICLSAFVGSITHAVQGNINWLFAAALIPGAWAGGRLGVWLSRRLQTRWIIFTLRLVLIATGVRLIWNGVMSA